jgi:cation diffusion facilitator CzcD-associated flavoprotein CzcO
MVEHTDVAIIGAGPAGLAVGACLIIRQAGLNFIILERDQKVASSWHRHYERLHLHTVKQLSSLPHVPFPTAYPRYVPRNLMIEYLDRYAAKFDLKSRFGDAARSVCRDGNGWRIQGTSSSISAPYVVIASGFNAEPVIPSIPGMEKFRGKLIHSAACQC